MCTQMGSLLFHVYSYTYLVYVFRQVVVVFVFWRIFASVVSLGPKERKESRLPIC